MRGRSELLWAIGDTLAPAVAIQILPLGVLKAQGLFFSNRYDLKYVGDFNGLTVWRDSTLVAPIAGGVREYYSGVDTTRVTLPPPAHAGFYVFDPRVFEPDLDGRVPRIQLVMDDANHPDYRVCLTLQRRQVATIWDDFETYFLEYPDERTGFVRARPELPQHLMADLPIAMTGCPDQTGVRFGGP